MVFCFFLLEASRGRRQPELLIFHIGENELSQMSSVELVSNIAGDLQDYA